MERTDGIFTPKYHRTKTFTNQNASSSLARKESNKS